MKYKTYLFDFDGTLVNSMPAFVTVMKRILDENNIKYGSDIVKIVTPLGYVGTASYFRDMGVPMTTEEILKLMKEYIYIEYKNNIPAKENVIAVLNELKKSGARLNVLTASPHLTLDVCLKRLGIFDVFDNVWSCDEDFATSKTNPEIYKIAAERIGEKLENILFLDDNFNAVKTAKLAGMKVCGVYDESSREYVEEMKEIADYYIYNFSELLEI